MIWDNQRSSGAIPVKVAAQFLGVSKSGYYNWLAMRGVDARAARNKPIVEEMAKIIYKNPGYGYRRMTRELWKHGYLVNHKRVLRLMRLHRLTIKKKKFKVITTDSEHGNPVYPNLILGMEITKPNQVWAADFTYIQVKNRFVYLAVELDLYSRRILGWALGPNLDEELAEHALHMALYNRRHDNLSGLIHHADQGVQYTSFDFTQCLRNHGIQISNSRKANPYDNAFVESFFKTLKSEEVYTNEYETIKDAYKNIKWFIEEIYNATRMHSALGYISPTEFERRRQFDKVASP
jgi:transposase InsO family protein